jgi:hypothetical protein
MRFLERLARMQPSTSPQLLSLLPRGVGQDEEEEEQQQQQQEVVVAAAASRHLLRPLELLMTQAIRVQQPAVPGLQRSARPRRKELEHSSFLFRNEKIVYN